MPKRPRLRPTFLTLTAALVLAACAPTHAPAPDPTPSDPQTPVVQPMALRLLDSRDRPLAGVAVSITPRLGRPQQPGPHVTDQRGLLDLAWLPQVKDDLAHLRSPDKIISYNSALSYVIEAPGFLPAQGAISTSARSRSLKSAELATLGAELALGSHTETVVLRRPAELLGRGLRERPADDPLAARCLAFHRNNQALAKRLGTELTWPAFFLDKGTLTLTLDWRGITWGGLKHAPLVGQVALNAGAPLAMAVGLDLLPAPEVERVSIQFLNELPPESDQSGPPRKARVVIEAPAEPVMALAEGKLSPDRFLQDFPPRLVIDPLPGG